jgi:DNA repair exonuclease SbcCD ATPase subunit
MSKSKPGKLERVVPLEGGDIQLWSDGHAHAFSPTSSLDAAKDDIARLQTDLAKLQSDWDADVRRRVDAYRDLGFVAAELRIRAEKAEARVAELNARLDDMAHELSLANAHVQALEEAASHVLQAFGDDYAHRLAPLATLLEEPPNEGHRRGTKPGSE